MVQGVTQKPDLSYPVERPVQQPQRGTVELPRPPVSTQVNAQSTPVTHDEVVHAIQYISKESHQAGDQLQISVDSDLDRVIVKIVDSQSGQVIRQIPAEELINLAKQLKNLNGLLVEKHV
ncbi:MAG: Flagellar protein FlaG [Nitrospira sp.]